MESILSYPCRIYFASFTNKVVLRQPSPLVSSAQSFACSAHWACLSQNLAGRQAVGVAEGAGEMGEVFEAAAEGNVRHGVLGAKQEVSGFFQAEPKEEVLGGWLEEGIGLAAQVSLQYSLEVGCCRICLFGLPLGIGN